MSENKSEDLEYLEIAEEVVAIVAGIAATEVDGIAGMSGGIAGGFAEMLGRKNLTKGVEIELEGSVCTVNLYVIVDYGVSIPEVAKNVRKNVKDAVESMTGLSAEDIYIYVQGVEGVNVGEKEETKEEKEE